MAGPDCRQARFRSRHLRGRASAGVRRTGDRGSMDTPSPFPGENREENRGKVRPARARAASPRHPKNRAVGPELINSSRRSPRPAPRSPLAETPSPSALPQSGARRQDGARGRRHRRRVPRRARRAHALPDNVVNGGMAAAGATAASTSSRRRSAGNSAALAPPATAATVAEALVVAAEEASSSSTMISPSSPSSADVALAAGLGDPARTPRRHQRQGG